MTPCITCTVPVEPRICRPCAVLLDRFAEDFCLHHFSEFPNPYYSGFQKVRNRVGKHALRKHGRSGFSKFSRSLSGFFQLFSGFFPDSSGFFRLFRISHDFPDFRSSRNPAPSQISPKSLKPLRIWRLTAPVKSSKVKFEAVL